MRRAWVVILTLIATICATGAMAAPVGIDGIPVEFTKVASGFDSPVFLTSPPLDARIFVVEKVGRIRLLENGQPGQVLLDISSKVSRGNEQGLLGLAFHPDFAKNGTFYVDYTDKRGDTQIVSYRVPGGRQVADARSARTLLSIDQPYSNHNGGWIAFGPDGLLYIGMGDGGSGGDPHRNGQNPDVLLGKILRIDVDGKEPYGIPAGNPFASGGGAPEVFLLGLRNPWRSSFDGDRLYIGDVGQDRWEEVDVVSSTTDGGKNLGWNVVEDDHCYPEDATCDLAGFVEPVASYSHDEGCSVTGGYVYRGKSIPALDGRYFYADYCSGAIKSFRYAGGKATAPVDLADTLGILGAIQSFGVDSANELYILLAEGDILKLVAGS